MAVVCTFLVTIILAHRSQRFGNMQPYTRMVSLVKVRVGVAFPLFLAGAVFSFSEEPVAALFLFWGACGCVSPVCKKVEVTHTPFERVVLSAGSAASASMELDAFPAPFAVDRDDLQRGGGFAAVDLLFAPPGFFAIVAVGRGEVSVSSHDHSRRPHCFH